MLLILISWLNIAIIVYSAGYFTVSVLRLINIDIDYPNLNYLNVLLLGFASLYVFLTGIHFFTPINFYFFGCISGLAIFFMVFKYYSSVYNWLRTSVFQIDFKSKIVISSVILWVCLKASFPTASYDEGLYYIPFMNWTQQFPIVTGLGNLYGRLAFNSSWHTISSLFYFSNNRFSVNEINSFVGVVLAIFSAKSFLTFNDSRKIQDIIDYLPAFLILSTGIILDPVAINWFASNSADPLAGLFVLSCFLLYLNQIKDENRWLILIFSVFAVTIKISTLPILLLNLPVLTKGNIWKGTILASIILINWCLSNIILSGYVVYPISFSRISILDWAIPIENAQLETFWISGFAKLPNQDFSRITSMTLFSWIPNWWSNTSTISRSLVLLSLILWFTGLFFLIKKRIMPKKYLLVQITYLIGIILWFFNAPDIRFGIGFLLAPFLIFAWIFKDSLIPSKVISPLKWSCLVLFLWILFGNLHLATIRQLLVPDRVKYKNEISEKVKMGEVEIYKPIHWDQCWDGPLPCSPYIVYGDKFNSNIKMRGKTLAEGFMPLPLTTHRP